MAGRKSSRKKAKRVNLALQGGGVHGAFTWGVLDRLLDEEDVEIAGISGTSAGALNGAAFKAGMVRNGREGAREELSSLWSSVGAADVPGIARWLGEFSMGPVTKAIEYSPISAWTDAWAQFFSPYSYGPFYSNPLRSVVDAMDFDCICSKAAPDLFVSATRVRTGKVRVFSGEEISTDAILASACLPTVFQAVEIDDPETGRSEAYWDGGYTGNPALFPLFREDLPADIVIVNINPLERDMVPVTPQQIESRVNEISFNSSLLRELRAIAFVQRLLDQGRLKSEEKSRVLIHMISDDDLMNELSATTKMVPNPLIFDRLREAGRAAADRFLAANKDALNVRSSVDLKEMYS